MFILIFLVYFAAVYHPLHKQVKRVWMTWSVLCQGEAQAQVGTRCVARTQSAGVPGGGVTGEKRVIWSKRLDETYF